MASIAHFPARRNAIKKERFLFSLFPVHLLIRYAHLPASRADARLLRFVSDWISEHLSVKDDHFLSPALKSANQLSLGSSSGLSLMRMPSYIAFFCIRAALRVFPHRVQRPLVPQQRIQRHTEDFGKHQQLFRFRQRNIRLPFGNGLPGDGAALRISSCVMPRLFRSRTIFSDNFIFNLLSVFLDHSIRFRRFLPTGSFFFAHGGCASARRFITAALDGTAKACYHKSRSPERGSARRTPPSSTVLPARMCFPSPKKRNRKTGRFARPKAPFRIPSVQAAEGMLLFLSQNRFRLRTRKEADT